MYTHIDSYGMSWRFEGNRPVSALADMVMAQVAKDMARQKIKVVKSTAPNKPSAKRRKAAASHVG